MGQAIVGILAGLRASVLALLLLLAPIVASRAAAETITIALGTGSVFRLDQPFATVLIGDPNVVDVHAQNDRTVILQALKRGVATIVFVDARSVVIANIRVVVSDAEF